MARRQLWLQVWLKDTGKAGSVAASAPLPNGGIDSLAATPSVVVACQDSRGALLEFRNRTLAARSSFARLSKGDHICIAHDYAGA